METKNNLGNILANWSYKEIGITNEKKKKEKKVREIVQLDFSFSFCILKITFESLMCIPLYITLYIGILQLI